MQIGNRQPLRLGEVPLHRTLAPGLDRAWADCLGASADGRWDLPDPQRGQAGCTPRFVALPKSDPPSLQLKTMEAQREQWRMGKQRHSCATMDLADDIETRLKRVKAEGWFEATSHSRLRRRQRSAGKPIGSTLV